RNKKRKKDKKKKGNKVRERERKRAEDTEKESRRRRTCPRSATLCRQTPPLPLRPPSAPPPPCPAPCQKKAKKIKKTGRNFSGRAVGRDRHPFERRSRRTSMPTVGCCGVKAVSVGISGRSRGGSHGA
ncbi:MAG: hypothetical protein BJ554DRAFT_6079, partial [Olpidium bornovanus]